MAMIGLFKNEMTLMKHWVNFTKSYYSNCNIRPGVLLDVDGVVKRGKVPIPQAKKSIELLRKKGIPFLLVTNGGGGLESSKVAALSSMLQLNKENALNSSEIVLCHTPMKSILNKFSMQQGSKIPLIVGCGDLHDIMKSYGVKKYITDVEYATIFPQCIGFNCIKNFLPMRQTNKTQVENRLGYKINDNKLLGINGIFQITDALNWEIPIQLCCDLLISKDGIPGTERCKDDPCKVEYHLANPDIDFADNFPIPRFGGGSYFYSLQSLFQLKYKFQFPFISYGKPHAKIYDFAKKRLSEMYPDVSIRNYYMIGDNPDTDIKGANNLGLYSILVRTGMFNQNGNKSNPAKKVVDHIYDGIKYIIDKEKL